MVYKFKILIRGERSSETGMENVLDLAMWVTADQMWVEDRTGTDNSF